ELGMPTGSSAVHYVNVACVGRSVSLGQTAMCHAIYAYIAKTTTQVCAVLRTGGRRRSPFPIGKRDPPRKSAGSVDEAVSLVFSGTDLMEVTHVRAAARKLDI